MGKYLIRLNNYPPLHQQINNDRALSNNSEGLTITHNQSHQFNLISINSIYSNNNYKNISSGHVTNSIKTSRTITITKNYQQQLQYHPHKQIIYPPPTSPPHIIPKPLPLSPLPNPALLSHKTTFKTHYNCNIPTTLTTTTN